MIFKSVSSSSTFPQLQQHLQDMREQNLHMTSLFEQQSDRFADFSVAASGLFLDYSKNQITQKTLGLLFEMARECQVEKQRDAMFAGEKINSTENRSVLHTALRAPRNQPTVLNGVDINQEIHAVLDRMQQFVEKIHSGAWRGASGQVLTDVVNIGIGGSDLGPQMVSQALRCFAHPGTRCHFVSNVDGHDLDAVLQQVDPATTLFIVSSKTFTTAETMLNANSARSWFLKKFSETDLPRHFVAVTTNLGAANQFGIASENCFGF